MCRIRQSWMWRLDGERNAWLWVTETTCSKRRGGCSYLAWIWLAAVRPGTQRCKLGPRPKHFQGENMKTTYSFTMSLNSSQQCGEKGTGGSVHPASSASSFLARRGLILLDMACEEELVPLRVDNIKPMLRDTWSSWITKPTAFLICGRAHAPQEEIAQNFCFLPSLTPLPQVNSFDCVNVSFYEADSMYISSQILLRRFTGLAFKTSIGNTLWSFPVKAHPSPIAPDARGTHNEK